MRVLGRLVAILIGGPLVLLTVVFAVANRQAVPLDLWPLPWTIEVSAYLVGLAPLAAGLILGTLLGRFSRG